MSGNKLFVDTNILIYFLPGDNIAIDLILEKELIISFVTELELLSFGSVSEDASGVVKGFLKNCLIIDINPEIKELTIESERVQNLNFPMQL